jgi:hypothetical protein
MECYTLGFTYDDVVGAWQDWRLAQECVRVFSDPRERALAEEVWEVPGDGPYLLRWYVSRAAAEVLDAHEVPWRQFLVGTGHSPSSGRHPIKV